MQKRYKRGAVDATRILCIWADSARRARQKESKEMKTIAPSHTQSHTHTKPNPRSSRALTSTPLKLFLHHSACPQHTDGWNKDWNGFPLLIWKNTDV